MKSTVHMPRSRQSKIVLHSGRVRYKGNGLRSVPLEYTLAAIEEFFLASPVEVELELVSRDSHGTRRAILELLTAPDAARGPRYSGKGASDAQAVASGCMEFVERISAAMRPGDELLEASADEVAGEAVDPRLFWISAETGFDSTRRIDWVRGYSLTSRRPVLVPANLVFAPYTPSRPGKAIGHSDSNGLASGNNLEEAILHGILEVVERDAAMIGEYNRLSRPEIEVKGLPRDVQGLLDWLSRQGYRCSFRSAMTDIPIPAVSAFLRHAQDPARTSVAFGCHLDPGIACSRALTEAVQLQPPARNLEAWRASGSPEHYAAPAPSLMKLKDLGTLATNDLKEDIEICVGILSKAGAEVIVVDLSLPDVPFPAVRVLATGLQPVLREGDLRLSTRFFEVPVKLGLRDRSEVRSGVKLWPLCGYC